MDLSTVTSNTDAQEDALIERLGTETNAIEKRRSCNLVRCEIGKGEFPGAVRSIKIALKTMTGILLPDERPPGPARGGG